MPDVKKRAVTCTGTAVDYEYVSGPAVAPSEEQRQLGIETVAAALLNPGYRYEIFARGSEVHVREMREGRRKVGRAA